jgi:DNA-binding IclR family transcriptional regulator
MGSLLAFDVAATPERLLRVAARRPLAELVIRTGAGAALSARLGSETVLLDAFDAPRPLGLPLDPGTPVWPGTAMARIHDLSQSAPPTGRPRISVDAGEFSPGLTCVAAAVTLPGGGLAAIATLFEASWAPRAVLEATRAAAEQVTTLLQGGVVAATPQTPPPTPFTQ